MQRATRHGGFTLVETLVAISILTIVIVGPFQIIQGVLQSSYNARDQLIATSLAQEALEYVRQVRDSNFLYNLNNGGAGRTWLYGFDGTMSSTNCGVDGSVVACVVDPALLTITLCSGTDCSALPLKMSAKNVYTQSAGGTTPFTRSVQFIPISSHEMLVKVTVSWSNHGAQSVVLTENIQDWL